MIDLVIFKDEKQYSLRKDFNMRILGFNVTPPETITNIVSIPYSNNYIDLTEIYGNPTYGQREVIVNVDSIENTDIWHKYVSELFNLFHGKLVKIYLTSDSEYYYQGRMSIELSNREDNLVNRLALKLLADPFKTHFKTGEKRL